MVEVLRLPVLSLRGTGPPRVRVRVRVRVALFYHSTLDIVCVENAYGLVVGGVGGKFGLVGLLKTTMLTIVECVRFCCTDESGTSHAVVIITDPPIDQA